MIVTTSWKQLVQETLRGFVRLACIRRLIFLLFYSFSAVFFVWFTHTLSIEDVSKSQKCSFLQTNMLSGLTFSDFMECAATKGHSVAQPDVFLYVGGNVLLSHCVCLTPVIVWAMHLLSLVDSRESQLSQKIDSAKHKQKSLHHSN